MAVVLSLCGVFIKKACSTYKKNARTHTHTHTHTHKQEPNCSCFTKLTDTQSDFYQKSAEEYLILSKAIKKNDEKMFTYTPT